jgi:hypothetical protein
VTVDVLESVLDDVLGGGEVPDHQQCQPDKLGLVVAEQILHRCGPVAAVQPCDIYPAA